MKHYKETQSEKAIKHLESEISYFGETVAMVDDGYGEMCFMPNLDNSAAELGEHINQYYFGDQESFFTVAEMVMYYKQCNDGLQILLFDKNALHEILKTQYPFTEEQIRKEAYKRFPYDFAAIEPGVINGIKFSTVFMYRDHYRKQLAILPMQPESVADNFSDSDDIANYLDTSYEKTISELLNIAFYVSCVNADIRCVYKPAKHQSKSKKNRNRSKATIWEAGYRIGDALRSYERTKSQSHNHTGIKVRPHVRRAHFHTYHTKNGDVLKWLSPMIINKELGEVGCVGHKVA